jgi:hypothetical protein
VTVEPKAAAAGSAGLTDEEARRRLEQRGEQPAAPSSRSVASIVRSTRSPCSTSSSPRSSC